ncbi:MAG: rod shape-determining protein MreC [Ilumatobacteraceae bacterium]
MATYSPGRRRVIIALALTSLFLLTLDLRGNQVLDGVRSGFGFVFRPINRAGEVVTTPVVRLWRSYREFDDLEEENRQLRAEIDGQRSAEIAAQNAIIENQDLLALAGLESLASYGSVTGRLVGQSPSNFDQQVEIDRGAIHGIRVGMAAINEAGLVGKVTSVAPQSSIIMLVTDPSYAVPVKILASNEASGSASSTATTTPSTTEVVTGSSQLADSQASLFTDGESTSSATTTTVVEIIRETGVLRGQGSDRLPRVSFIASGIGFGQIEVGDTVFTAGGSTSLAPPNIPLGRVLNVITRAGTAGQELEIEPTADLSRLQFVRVVLYQPASEVGQ